MIKPFSSPLNASTPQQLSIDGQILWREYKHPYNYHEKLSTSVMDSKYPTLCASQNNSLCGESTTIIMHFSGPISTNIAPTIFFSQKQCSIAIATGSLLCKWSSQIPLKDLIAYAWPYTHLETMQKWDKDPPLFLEHRNQEFHDYIKFLATSNKYPARSKCYAINLQAFQNCLAQAKSLLHAADKQDI